jgi:hypothetical protein
MLLDAVRKLLVQAQSSRGDERHSHIKKVCDLIWDDETVQDDKLSDTLTDIAYTLEDYEPNPTWRKQDPSYYGDERLEQEIISALQILKEY